MARARKHEVRKSDMKPARELTCHRCGESIFYYDGTLEELHEKAVFDGWQVWDGKVLCDWCSHGRR